MENLQIGDKVKGYYHTTKDINFIGIVENTSTIKEYSINKFFNGDENEFNKKMQEDLNDFPDPEGWIEKNLKKKIYYVKVITSNYPSKEKIIEDEISNFENLPYLDTSKTSLEEQVKFDEKHGGYHNIENIPEFAETIAEDLIEDLKEGNIIEIGFSGIWEVEKL